MALPAKKKPGLPKFDPGILQYLNNEALARKAEADARHHEIEKNTEVELKMLENNNAIDLRQFDAFSKEHAFSVKKFNFTAALMIGGSLFGAGIIVYAIKLASEGQPLGMDILKVVLGYLGGLATGWGITKAKK